MKPIWLIAFILISIFSTRNIVIPQSYVPFSEINDFIDLQERLEQYDSVWTSLDRLGPEQSRNITPIIAEEAEKHLKEYIAGADGRSSGKSEIKQLIKEAGNLMYWETEELSSPSRLEEVGNMCFQISTILKDRPEAIHFELLGMGNQGFANLYRGEQDYGMEYLNWCLKIVQSNRWESYVNSTYSQSERKEFSAGIESFQLIISALLGKAYKPRGPVRLGSPPKNISVLRVVTQSLDHLNKGDTNIALNNLVEFCDTYSKSETVSARMDKMFLYAIIGGLLLEEGREKEGFQYLKNAIQEIQDLEMPWYIALLKSLSGYAKLMEFNRDPSNMKPLNEAEQVLGEAVDIFDRKLRENSSKSQTWKREEMSLKGYEVYLETLLTLAFQTKNPVFFEAIYLQSERNRGLQLKHQLALNEQKLLENRDFDPLGILQGLNDSINRMKFREEILIQRMKRDSNHHVPAIWKDWLSNIRANLAMLESDLGQLNDYQSSALSFSNSILQTPNLKDLESMLQETGENIISYTVTDQYVYSILINSDTLHIEFLRSQNNLDTLTKEFYGIVSGIYPKDEFERLHYVGSRLFNKLVKPLEPLFVGNKLTVVRSGCLQDIPFDAFQTEYRNPRMHSEPYTLGEFNELPYMIKKYDISYIPSITQYFYSHQNREPDKNWENGILALAPGTFHGKKSSLQGSWDPQKYNPAFAQELAEISEGQALVYDEATKEAFWDLGPQHSCIVIASHGFANPKTPFLGSIALASEELVTDRQINGELFMWELSGKKIDCELIVLNACQTALGKAAPLEGSISFPKSFLGAGVSSVVATKWEVDEETNNQILKDMFHNIQAGQSRSEALRNAKLTYLKSAQKGNASPFWWAGSELNGGHGVMILNKGTRSWFSTGLLYGIVPLLGIVLAIILGRMRSGRPITIFYLVACIGSSSLLGSGCASQEGDWVEVDFNKRGNFNSNAVDSIPNSNSPEDWICYGDSLDLSKSYITTMTLAGTTEVNMFKDPIEIVQEQKFVFRLGFIGVSPSGEPIIMARIEELKFSSKLTDPSKVKTIAPLMPPAMDCHYKREENGDIVSLGSQNPENEELCMVFSYMLGNPLYVDRDDISPIVNSDSSTAVVGAREMLQEMVSLQRKNLPTNPSLPQIPSSKSFQPNIDLDSIEAYQGYLTAPGPMNCKRPGETSTDSSTIRFLGDMKAITTRAFLGWDSTDKYLVNEIHEEITSNPADSDPAFPMDYYQEIHRKDYINPNTGFMEKAEGSVYLQVIGKMNGSSIDFTSLTTERSSGYWESWTPPTMNRK